MDVNYKQLVYLSFQENMQEASDPSHSDHIVQTKGQGQNMWPNEWQSLNIKFILLK